MAGKNRLLAKILGNNDGLITPDSDLLAVASTKNIPAAVGTSVYSSIDDLPSTAPAGEKALITSTNSLYLYNGGWYRIAVVNNFNPQWLTEPDSEYTLELSSVDSDLRIVVYATDSDDVPITYTAVVDSDFNVAATVTHDSDKDNIWIVRRRDSELGAGTTGDVTFKASDGTNFVQKTTTFTIVANFVLVRISQIEGIWDNNKIMVDSDMGSILSNGDIVTDSDATNEATVSTVTFLDNTLSVQTNIGTLIPASAGDQGTGYFGIEQDGTFNNDHIGRVVSLGSSNTTAASRFRTGNASGGQIISSYTTQTYSTSSSTTSASANSPHYVFGAPLKSMTNNSRAQLLVAQGYGTINPALSTGTYSFNSDGSNPATVNSIRTTYQGHTIKQHNPGGTASSNFDYLTLIMTYWNGRYNYMEYTNTANVTYFRCQYNRTSYFSAGKVLYPTYSSPTNREIFEGKCLAVMSSSYNSGTNETTVYCGNQFGLQIRNWEDTGGTSRQMTTGSVTTPANGGHYYAVWISKNAQAMQLITGSLNSTSLDITWNQSIQGVQLNYARDLNFYQTSTTNTNTNYYKVATTPSPAGNGTNISLGTGNAGSSMYSWKNTTRLDVDSNSGFVAGKDIKKKT